MNVYKYRVPKEIDKRRKVTDEQREEIKALHKQGESYYSIAKKYGISGIAVRNICNPLSKEYIANRNRKAAEKITTEKRREYYLRHIARKKELMEEERALWE